MPETSGNVRAPRTLPRAGLRASTDSLESVLTLSSALGDAAATAHLHPHRQQESPVSTRGAPREYPVSTPDEYPMRTHLVPREYPVSTP